MKHLIVLSRNSSILVTAATVCVAILFSAYPAWPREKVEIAMILYRGQTPSEKGFIETLQKSKEYEVHFNIFDSNGDSKKLDTIVKDLVPGKYRLIYAFGTTVAQKLMTKTKDVPIVFNIVQRPIEGGIVKDFKSSVHPQNLWVPFGSGRSPSV